MALQHLPHDFLVSVLKDFLTLRAVARLDWSVSERAGRARLMEVLGS